MLKTSRHSIPKNSIMIDAFVTLAMRHLRHNKSCFQLWLRSHREGSRHHGSGVPPKEKYILTHGRRILFLPAISVCEDAYREETIDADIPQPSFPSLYLVAMGTKADGRQVHIGLPQVSSLSPPLLFLLSFCLSFSFAPSLSLALRLPSVCVRAVRAGCSCVGH